MHRVIVTLDGPAGSGKSTVARLLARRLGVAFLDTGAMYRGLTAACLDAGVDPLAEPRAAADMAARVTLRFDWQTEPPRLLIEGRDVTHRLRSADVTDRVSPLASLAEVRRVLVEAQRRIGDEHPRLVTEGRDQGSVVFPDAAAKFFLDARPEVRARRRAQQLRDAGQPADEPAILAQLIERDQRDSSRAAGPLMCPDDAECIDTSEMTLDEVVDVLEQRVRNKLSSDGGCDGSPHARQHTEA